MQSPAQSPARHSRALSSFTFSVPRPRHARMKSSPFVGRPRTAPETPTLYTLPPSASAPSLPSFSLTTAQSSHGTAQRGLSTSRSSPLITTSSFTVSRRVVGSNLSGSGSGNGNLNVPAPHSRSKRERRMSAPSIPPMLFSTTHNGVVPRSCCVVSCHHERDTNIHRANPYCRYHYILYRGSAAKPRTSAPPKPSSASINTTGTGAGHEAAAKPLSVPFRVRVGDSHSSSSPSAGGGSRRSGASSSTSSGPVVGVRSSTARGVSASSRPDVGDGVGNGALSAASAPTPTAVETLQTSPMQQPPRGGSQPTTHQSRQALRTSGSARAASVEHKWSVSSTPGTDALSPPTVYLSSGKVKREYGTKRLPAYCDRIVWRSHDQGAVKPLSYDLCADMRSSDHIPVILDCEMKLTPSIPVEAYLYPCEVVLTGLELTLVDSPHVQRYLPSDHQQHQIYVSFTGSFLSESSRSSRTPVCNVKWPASQKTLNARWDDEYVPILQGVCGFASVVRNEKICISIREGNMVDESEDGLMGNGILLLRPRNDTNPQQEDSKEDCSSPLSWVFSIPIERHGSQLGALSGRVSIFLDPDEPSSVS